MDRPPLLVIAAGGTGGHMFPAQALAEEMLARGWRVQLSTDARGARYADGFPASVERQVVSSATFTQGSVLKRMGAPFAIAAGAVSGITGMLRDRPDCVAGFGGYPTIPAMIAAGVLKVPRLIHEQNAVPGRVNRAFARRVDVVACGTWPARLPEGVRHAHTGNPVRAAVLALSGADYLPPANRPMGLLVIGGSQGAGLFSHVVPDALALLKPETRALLRLSQQVRPEDMARMRETCDRLEMTADLRGFFDDVPDRLAEATLVISRAGASSIADITVIGRPAVLIPYAAATDDHQAANAEGLVSAGGAFMIREQELTAPLLAGHITEILADPDGAAAMAQASLSRGMPDATSRLAGLVEDISKRGRKT